jgi:xanthine dehydrogenase YagT iron-sulfur-binding subunit
MPEHSDFEFSRRKLLLGTATSVALVAVSRTAVARSATLPETLLAPETPMIAPVSLRVNGVGHDLDVDTRTTLLDVLREHLHLTGTKKDVTMASAAPAP